jgi:hypothetical protein
MRNTERTWEGKMRRLTVCERRPSRHSRAQSAVPAGRWGGEVEAAEAEIQKVSEYHDWDGTAL